MPAAPTSGSRSRRGEIDGECGGWTSVPEDWLRDNKINVVIRLSPTLVAGMDATVPFGGDLVKNARERKIYDFLTAPERLGRLFMVSAKVPADRVAALRAAFDAMVADAGFLRRSAEIRAHGHTDDRQRRGSRDRGALCDASGRVGAGSHDCRGVIHQRVDFRPLG